MINKRLLSKLQSSKKYIGLTVFLNWISLIFNVISIFYIANLLESVMNSTYNQSKIIFTAIIVSLSITIRAIANLLASRTAFLSAASVKRVLREDIYKKLLKLGISYNEKIATSEIVQVAVEGVEQLEIYFGQYLPQLFYSLLAPFTLFIILSFVNFRSALILLICVPLIPVSIMVVQKIAKKLLSQYWGIYTEMGDSFLENIQGLTTLKIYEVDDTKSDEMDIEAERFRKITMRVLTMQLNSITIMDLIAYGGAALGVIISINEYMKGNIGFAGTFAIIMLSAEYFIPLRLLGSFFHIAMNGMAASEKIFKILDLDESVSGSEEISSNEIIFDKFTFSYDDERRILQEMTFEIKEKDFVSFVGESGSGKSTIASLIMGMNKNYQGSLKIGSNEIKDIREENLMNNITLVTHNSYLFKGTVRENLLMGKKDASLEEMNSILKKVNLYKFLNESEGLETKLEESAANLSGGQKQRLALARALLHDTPIYIFDEVTSNIDSDSELLIMKVIEELAKDKTVLLISHRMANVVNSDRIYVLDEGHLIESGSHKQLMELDGHYKKLFTHQKKLEAYSVSREEEVDYA